MTLLAALGGAAAEPLPRPSVDFAVKGTTPGREASLDLAHRGGQLRLDVGVAGLPGGVTGLIDPKRRKVVVLAAVPGMQNVAIEMDLPAEYAFASMPAEGVRGGAATVAGEACEVWRSTVKGVPEPVEACITADGIVLRTEASINGRRRVVFEATEVVRAPQDPARFALPPGMKVTRLPKGMQGLLPGGLLPGLGN
ncbi:MAG TPA: hypothetical protein VLA00_00360 [Xanthobacteraceae bacterium]|nr:hypothetical protein [Xanthobacteraceae bacterium]